MATKDKTTYVPVNGGFSGFQNMYPGYVESGYGNMTPKEVGSNIVKALPEALAMGAFVGAAGAAWPELASDLTLEALGPRILTVPAKAAIPETIGAAPIVFGNKIIPEFINAVKAKSNKKNSHPVSTEIITGSHKNVLPKENAGGQVNYFKIF